MSLQWQFAAYILYVETFLVLLLALPFISNKFWHRIFKIKLFSWIGMIGQHAFLVIAGILSLLFLDSIREIQKYEGIIEETEGQMGINMNNPHTNKFRAQRNFYITLGAFLFWIVLRRLVTVISNAAVLEAKCHALEKQAKGASAMAESLMKDDKKSKKSSGDDDDGSSELQEEIEKLKTKLAESRAAEGKAVDDLEVVKKQAKATEREYDRLMVEMEKLQGGNDGKKDE